MRALLFPQRRWLRLSVSPFAVAVLLAVGASTGATTSAAEPTWRAGLATVDITPTEPQWMAGYAARVRPSEGTLHPLHAKALALEDAAHHRAVIVTTDLLGIPQPLYEETFAAIAQQCGLTRDQLMLAASHTHCGPVLRGAIRAAFTLTPSQEQVIERYSDGLVVKLTDVVRRALAALAPARVAAGEGHTGFAVNRRENPEGAVPSAIAQHLLKGPVDHSVPVLAVSGLDGTLRAVVFGYACHNTTLSFYQWAGDYAGFAQIALERHHPGATALFFQGCGADQNPLPRREVYLAERYGDMLAAAVEEVLLQAPAALPPTLQTAHEFATLHLAALPPVAELEALVAAPKFTPIEKRWATLLLADLRAGKTPSRDYPYPIEVWRLGGRQLWIALGGETVVYYSIRLKAEYGAATWITGYANDVMAYIPSRRVLDEDKPPRAPGRAGYEGNTAMYAYGQPAHRWADDVEEIIVDGVRRLARPLLSPPVK